MLVVVLQPVTEKIVIDLQFHGWGKYFEAQTESALQNIGYLPLYLYGISISIYIGALLGSKGNIKSNLIV